MQNWYLVKYTSRLLLFFFISGCIQNNDTSSYPLNIPQHFPKPTIPIHNELTKAKVELGKKLFFDPILSSDNSVSCASCHKPEFAFANHEIKSIGINQTSGERNVPTLVNIAYHPYLFAEGEVPDLESQVLAPVLHENEMGINLKQSIKKLNNDSEYRKLFKKAFDTLASTATLVRAIATYERTLISGNSSYDQYIQGNKNALDSSQQRGMKLFFSDRTNCSSCHAGFNFTNYQFENIGLQESYIDIGKMRATGNPKDEGKFKTPTLRNIEYTWPYMHNGSLKTLEEVVDFYNSGGKNHPQKSKKIKPIHLSVSEKNDLINFLKSLSDQDLKMRKGIFAP